MRTWKSRVSALAFSLLAIVGFATPTAAAAPAWGVRSYPDLTYATAGGTDLKLDLYLPERVTAPVPVVVYVHGGAWQTGSRKGYGIPMPWGTVEGVAGDLARRGYAVASIDYRLSQQAQWPAQIHDAKAAVRWLRASAGTFQLDPTRFAAWGDSAGGHLAALLGTSAGVAELEGTLGHPDQSSRVQAVVSWFGPTDLLTMDEQAPPFSQKHDEPGSPEDKLLGCVPSACPGRAKAASPVSYANAQSPPFLFQHGRLDHVVPYGQSLELKGVLTRAGVSAQVHGYPFADHEFLGLIWPGELMTTFFTFLDKQLKNR